MTDQLTMDSKILNLISAQLGKSVAELHPSKTFMELGLDSLDMTEMVMQLEQELNIEISDEDAQKLTTIGSVIEFVKSKG